MNANLACQEKPWEEKLNGQIILMSPRPSINHNRVVGNIYHIFRTYLKGKTCEGFCDGVDVFITEENNVIPDAMIICNKDIIKPDGIHGAPDLIAEVLSPSTAKMTADIKRNFMKDPASRNIGLSIRLYVP